MTFCCCGEDARLILSSRSSIAFRFFHFCVLLIKRFRDSYLDTVAGVACGFSSDTTHWCSSPLDKCCVCVCVCVCFFFFFFVVVVFHGLMMERIRKEMILMERGLHSPVAGKRLADTPGNSVLEALENSQHGGRLSPRITSASLHGNLGDIPTKSKFEIDSIFGTHHGSENSSSAEISSSESRKKMSLYSEVSQESDINSDVEVGCPAHRSPSQHKENNKGKILFSSVFLSAIILDMNITIIVVIVDYLFYPRTKNSKPKP